MDDQLSRVWVEVNHYRAGSVLGFPNSSLAVRVVSLDVFGEVAASPAGLHLLSLKDVEKSPYGSVDRLRVVEGDLIYVDTPEVPVDVFPR